VQGRHPNGTLARVIIVLVMLHSWLTLLLGPSLLLLLMLLLLLLLLESRAR
jgi:hypothetical protein